MRRYFSLALRRFGLLSFDLLVSPVSQYPSNKEIPPGELWLVVDSGIKKWACLNCPGGCGVQISLSLNPDRRPRWTINQDLWGRPTVFSFNTSTETVQLPLLDSKRMHRMV
jgi:hypothetical protein